MSSAPAQQIESDMPHGRGIAPVCIQLLSRFAVRRGDQEVPLRPFGGRLARRLLRMLALSRGMPLSKEVAAEALWPSCPPADAPGNVEILVSRIRRALGDRSLVETGPAGYTLVGDERCWVDVEAFLTGVVRGEAELGHDPVAALAAFRSALALWRGEPLPEDAYVDWAAEHRRHLWRARLQALEGAAGAALAVGDPISAREWAQAATEQEPLREASAMLLARALAAGGDPVGALATFDAFGRRLGDELGVDPSAEAMDLRQRVLRDQIRTGRVGGGDDADRARTLAPPPALPTVRQRVAAAPARHREVLALVALLDRHAPASLLAATTGADIRDTLDVLDALARAGLVAGGADGWTVATRTGRDAVVRALGSAERARLHRLLAEALRQQEADDAEIATHLAAGGDQQAAAAVFAAAAHARLDRIADEEARRLAEAGLALPARGATRAALLEARGEAHRRRGRISQARTDLDDALIDQPAGPDRSRILARLAILEARSRDALRGDEVIELAIAEAGDDPAARGQALAAAAIIDLTLPRLDRARRRFRQAQHLLNQAGDSDGAARLLYWRGIAQFVAGRLPDAARQLEPLAHLPVTPPEVLRLWNPQAIRGHALVFMAEPAAGLTEIDQALAWTRTVEHPVAQCMCLWHRSEALAALRRHADAVDSARSAVAIARRAGHVEETAAALSGLGVAWHAAGDLQRAEDCLRGALRTAQRVPLFAGWAAARLGLVLVEQGRLAEATGLIDTALRYGTPLIWHEARRARAELLRARGDRTARQYAAAALGSARADGYLALVPRLATLAQP